MIRARCVRSCTPITKFKAALRPSRFSMFTFSMLAPISAITAATVARDALAIGHVDADPDRELAVDFRLPGDVYPPLGPVGELREVLAVGGVYDDPAARAQKPHHRIAGNGMAALAEVDHHPFRSADMQRRPGGRGRFTAGRFAHREGIGDRALCDAVERIAKGLADADLGGGVIKQRIARKGGGRSGGFRTIVLFRRGELAFYVYGFAKSDRENLRRNELETFRPLADEYLALDRSGLASALAVGAIIEVNCDDQAVQE